MNEYHDSHDDDMPMPGQLTDDSDLADLITFFLGELKVRADAMMGAWASGELDDLQSLVHELNDAGSGYGFPVITEQAALLEASLLSNEAELSSIGEQVESLIELCRHAGQTDGGTKN